MNRLGTAGATGRGELGGVSESKGLGNRTGGSRSTWGAVGWALRLTSGAALVVALGGCTANLADAVRARIPGGAYIPPEVAEKAGNEAGAAVDAQVIPEVVDHLGDVAFQIKLKTCKRSNSPRATATAKRVSQQIIDAVSDTRFAATGKGFTWQVEVVEDPEINAMAFPGGKIIVNSRLLSFANEPGHGGDAWVATVLSHEVVHALARHATEGVKQALGDTMDLTSAGLRLSAHDLNPKQTAALLAAMGVPYEGVVLTAFAREKESEADQIGLQLMAHAGYDPRAALAFWQQRAAQPTSGGVMPVFLSLHPTDAQRISQLREWIPEAEAQLKTTRRDDRGTDPRAAD